MSLINVNSLPSKISYLVDYFWSHPINILAVTETWLTPLISDSVVNIHNFSIYRSDSPSGTAKHGVCIYVHKDIKFVPVSCNIPNTLIIHLTQFDVFVILVYRPPSNSQEDNHNLISFIHSFCYSKEFVLLGDFNLPSIDWSSDSPLFSYMSPTDKLFYDCFVSLGLNQWVVEPTFLSSGNILDLVFTSDDDRVGEIEVLAPLPHCQHTMIMFTYIFQTLEHFDNVLPTFTKRCWYKGKYNLINEYLISVDWHFEFFELSATQMFQRLLDILNSLITYHIPTHETYNKPISNINPPKRLIRQKQVAWQEYKQLRSRLIRYSPNTQDALTNLYHINYQY